MRQNLFVWKYQAKLFLRNRILLAGVAILILSSIFAAGFGKYFVNEQNTIIDEQEVQLKKELEGMKNFHKPKILFHYTTMFDELGAYRPAPLASLAIGQKDNYPFYQRIGVIKNLYLTTPANISNPLKLLAGNFDLSYVLIFLFPLFIIVFGYNVLSEEKDNGTYTLLRVQGNERIVIVNKLLFRLVVILALSVLVNIGSFALNGISWKENAGSMLGWITITFFYILFWFALLYFVISLGRSSSINAVIMSCLWVFFLFLLPSVVHRNVSGQKQWEQVQALLHKRDGFTKNFKKDSVKLMKIFQTLDVPYRLPDSAKTESLIRNVQNIINYEVSAYRDSSWSRKPLQQQAEEYSKAISWNWINPVYATQNAFNQLANTEINNYHDYLDASNRWQTEKRYRIHAQMADDIPITWETVDHMPKFKYQPQPVGYGRAMYLMLPVLALTALCICFGSLNRRRQLAK